MRVVVVLRVRIGHILGSPKISGKSKDPGMNDAK